MVLIDTSVLIDFFQGASTAEAVKLEALIRDACDTLRVADLSFLEVLSGLRTPRAVRETLEALEEFHIIPLTGQDLMIQAAAYYRRLRSERITVRSMIDCLIATYAIENQMMLLHRDKDFLPFEKYFGLKNALKESSSD